ncbi:MAG: PspC domain-containing protein [Patescibacteria group bacterium]|nr:PspC domain-containing protein [Patescibacteria group bacterium]
MNKAVNIELNGVLFHIEEGAYAKLKEYLDSIKGYYSNRNGDAKEIIKDIESSIADKFTARPKGKEVITLADVEALIKVMGTVEDFAAVEEDAGEIEKPEPHQESQASYRRLYRNPDDKVIAGVASGIASYFGFDPVIARLIFFASIFLGGTGIIAYLVMWVIVPEAETSTQKLEMQGKPITLKKIEQVSRKIAKGGKKGLDATKKSMPAILGFFDSFFRWVGKFIQKAGPFFVSFIGAVLVFSFGVTILSLLVSWGIMLVSLDSPQLYFDYPFREMLGASTYYLGVSASMIIAIVPVVFLFLASLALMRRKNVFSGVLSGALIVLWMISIVVAGAIAVEAGPRVENIYEDINARLDSTRAFELNPFTSIETADDYDITFLKGDTYAVTAKGFDLFIDELIVEQTDNKITLRNEENERCFYFICDRPSMDVTVTLPTLAGIDFSLGDSKVDYLGFGGED